MVDLMEEDQLTGKKCKRTNHVNSQRKNILKEKEEIKFEKKERNCFGMWHEVSVRICVCMLRELGEKIGFT